MFQKKIPTLFRTRLPPCPFGNFLVWGTVINLWLVQDYKDAKKRKKRTVFAADTVAILRNVTPFSSQISRADPDPWIRIFWPDQDTKFFFYGPVPNLASSNA